MVYQDYPPVHPAQGGRSQALPGVRVEKAGTYLDGFTVEFEMEQAPVICSIDPAEAEAGTAVTITGRGFGATRGSSKVAFNGTPAREIVSWSPTSIIARVPGGATTGDVVVTVEGEQSNGLPFEVQPPDLVYPVRISYVSGQNHNMEELENRKGRLGLEPVQPASGSWSRFKTSTADTEPGGLFKTGPSRVL